MGYATQRSPLPNRGKRWDVVLPLKQPTGEHMVMGHPGSKTYNMLTVTRTEKTEKHYCSGPWAESFLCWSKVQPAKTHTRAPPDERLVCQGADVSWGVSSDLQGLQ